MGKYVLLALVALVADVAVLALLGLLRKVMLHEAFDWPNLILTLVALWGLQWGLIALSTTRTFSGS